MKRFSGTLGKTYFLLSAIFLGAYIAYLFRCHSVKGYSDPTHWIGMAEDILYRGTVDKWSTVFAQYLIAPLVLLGNHYVYLSNILWLACLVAATATLVALSCRGPQGTPLWDAGLLAGVSLAYFHGRFVIEIVNPYREPFSYAMLLLALNFIMLQHHRERVVWGVLSGIAFGVALGAREPNFFILLSIVNLFIYFAWRRPDRDPWLLPLSFAAGLLPGLVPFFVHNHLYSGVWWLPSYMKRRVLAAAPDIPLPILAWGGTVAFVAALILIVATIILSRRRRGSGSGTVTADRPRTGRLVLLSVLFTLAMLTLGVGSQKLGLVPGMKFSRFWPGLVKTSLYLFRKIGWAGLLLALFGIGYSFRRKHYPVLIVHVLSGCTFLWFWSYYYYVKPRYVFAVELFLYPLVGIGLWGLLSLIGRTVKPPSALRSLPHLATALLVLLAAGKFGSAALAGTGGLKVWQLDSLKAQLENSIERPYAFFGGRNHFSEILATVSGEPFTATFVSRYHQFFLRGHRVRESGMDGTLAEVREKALRLLDEKHLYSYAENKSSLVLQWFDYVPVLDMSTLTPQLRVYSNYLDGPLYEIRPWEAREVELDLTVQESGPCLVGLNAFRIWDYPGREYCRASIDGAALSEKLENGFHYYPAVLGEEGRGKARLSITSNSPLPRNPGVEIVNLNAQLDMEFGRKPLKWMNFISTELQGELFADQYGAALCESGEVTIPHFAAPERDVFVRFSYMKAPDEAPPAEETHLVFLIPPARESFVLDSGRKSSVVLDLGRGRGAYSPVTLRLALAADADGTPRPPGSGCFIIPEARVWTLPNVINAPAYFPADLESEPVFNEGFFPPGRAGKAAAQWSKPRARLRLPRIRAGGRRPFLVVRTNEFRAPAYRSRPKFSLNGRETDVAVRSGPEHIVEYVLTGLVWSEESANSLEIVTTAFNPKEALVSGDDRDLGINVVGIEVAFQ